MQRGARLWLYENVHTDQSEDVCPCQVSLRYHVLLGAMPNLLEISQAVRNVWQGGKVVPSPPMFGKMIVMLADAR